ncbi:MAG: hypothetical protein ACOCW6_06395 [Spirochaetota bacterium]
MLPPNPPYLLLRRHGRNLVGIGHRDSPLFSPGTRLLLVPSLGFAVTGKVRSGDRSDEIDVKLLGGRSGKDDVLALPFGAAAYLDSKARVSPGPEGTATGGAPDEATLLLAGSSLGSVRLFRGDSDLVLEANRLLPWYAGVPYTLETAGSGEYPISESAPVTKRPWSGRVLTDELEGAAVPDPEAGRVEVEGVLFPSAAYERLAGQAKKAARKEGGVPKSAVHKALGPLQNPIRGPFVDSLVSGGYLKDLGDRLIENPPEKTLSPISRGVLRELDAAGSSGITLGDRPKGFRDAALRLEAMHFAVVVAGRIAWSASGFSSAVASLRKRFRGTLEADDVAGYLSCSKTLAKDVLRRMADEGFVYSTAAGTAKWRHRGRT